MVASASVRSMPFWWRGDHRTGESADDVIRELGAPPITASEDAKDDAVRRLVENEHYRDARRLLRVYYSDRLVKTADLADEQRLRADRGDHAHIDKHLPEAWLRHLDLFFAREEFDDLLKKLKKKFEETSAAEARGKKPRSVVVSVVAEIRKAILRTNAWPPFSTVSRSCPQILRKPQKSPRAPNRQRAPGGEMMIRA